MNVTETKLKGVYVVEPQVFGDARGTIFDDFPLWRSMSGVR